MRIALELFCFTASGGARKTEAAKPIEQSEIVAESGS